MKKDNNTDHILKVLEDAEKAMPSEEFLTRIEKVATNYASLADSITMKSILGIAASFTLLIIMNIGLIKGDNNIVINESEVATESTYNLIPTKSPYNE